MLCVATLLLSIESITQEVRLEDLDTRTMFDLWLDAHDDHSPTATLGTIHAFIRIHVDRHGNDDVAEHMRKQTVDRRDAHALPAKAVRELSFMLREQRTIELLPLAFMTIASLDVAPVPTRLKLANMAAGMAGSDRVCAEARRRIQRGA